ncbi:MAG: heavy-metal-associated domain-containing protein [Nanoarchaeota archaeon]
MKKINLNIKGMHCASCSKLIKSELEDKGVKANIQDTGKALIEFDDKKISEQQIKDIITELGYKAK